MFDCTHILLQTVVLSTNYTIFCEDNSLNLHCYIHVLTRIFEFSLKRCIIYSDSFLGTAAQMSDDHSI